MKLISAFIVIFFLTSCATQVKTKQNEKPHAPITNCPENSNCTFEVFQNSSLQISNNGTGKINPKVISGNKLVFKYQLKKIVDQNIADGNYSEYIYFEIDKDVNKINLTNSDLQKVKMIYGRICYCRKNMGYFKVKEGNLFIQNKNNTLYLNLEFNMGKVPQITTKIKESIKY